MKEGDLDRSNEAAVVDNGRMVERNLLLTEIRYSNLVLKLGKAIEDPYCCQFNDDGYDQRYARFDNKVAIQSITEKATDDQLVTFFSNNPATGYTFRGRFYTLREGVLALDTDWPAIKDSLLRLEGKYPGSAASVLGACHGVCVKMDKQRNNYLHIQSVARDLGAENFRDVLTGLELAEIVIRNKGDIRIPPERIPLAKEFLKERYEEKESARVEEERRIAVPENLFGDIIGHGDVKELLVACLGAEKPVHVLLAGPPALAKTLFLWDIETAGGEKAIWLVGSAISKAGLWDLVAERQPQIILIDELDKMNAADTAALLSMMEGGRLVRAKVGRELNISNPIRVVAACNRLHSLSPELLSRFAVRKIQAYDRNDFLTVVKGVLTRREGVAEVTSEEIAHRLIGITQDVRDAIRVARLTPQLGVQKAIKLLLGG